MQQPSNEPTSQSSQSSQSSSSIPSTIDLDRIRAAIGSVLVSHEVSLVDVEWFTDQGAWTLRLTIEREGSSQSSDPSGGVSLDDCADVSRDVSTVLDAEDVIPHHYSLEVSSPGLDRKLRSPSDFVRFRGKTAKVKLAHPAPDGQRLLRGVLEEAPADRVAVLVDGKRIEAPLADVVEARLVFELAAQPKKGPRVSKGKRAKPKGGGGG